MRNRIVGWRVGAALVALAALACARPAPSHQPRWARTDGSPTPSEDVHAAWERCRASVPAAPTQHRRYAHFAYAASFLACMETEGFVLVEPVQE